MDSDHKKTITFPIPFGTLPAVCRGCKARIYWINMESGKLMPVNPDGVSHFATCIEAGRWRNRKKK